MTATAAEAVLEVDHIAAGLADKKLQNISSKAGRLIASAKTLSPVHRSLCWNNIAWKQRAMAEAKDGKGPFPV
jgi:hypothetical protein